MKVLVYAMHNYLLARSLRFRGLVGPADMRVQVQLPNSANWRWRTPEMCCSAVEPFFASLAQHHDATIFTTARGQLLAQSLASDDWMYQFKIVHFMTKTQQKQPHDLSWQFRSHQPLSAKPLRNGHDAEALAFALAH